MTRIIAIANQKGGVGKTTTAVNLAASLAELGQRVLLADLDPQGNATMGAGIQKRTALPTVYQILLNQVTVRDARMRSAPGHFDVIPANREVAGGHEIIAGERRWRAAQLAGLAEVPVLLREVADDAVAAMALIENIQREDLNAIDEAHGLQRLIHEFGMTHDAVAQAVGKSRAAVSNLLRLLNLSRPVQDMLTAGLIEMGHARALLPLAAAQQRELAHEVETRGLSVREVERRVARLKDPAVAAAKKKPASRDILRLEEALSDALGMTAHVTTTRTGGGRLTLHFASAEELEGLLSRLDIRL